MPRTFNPPNHKVRLVRNRSGRSGVTPRAIVIHSTESEDRPGTWDDLDAITGWFDTAKSQSSAHVGVDGDGHSVRWVPDEEKAWTALQANPLSLNIELVGRAAQPAAKWETAQLKTAAKWAAYWCRKYGIPARRGRIEKRNGQPVVTRTGIISHKQITDAGFGSHTDPGANFPWTRFLGYVAWYRRLGWQPGVTKQ